jgi:hypothetical protein
MNKQSKLPTWLKMQRPTRQDFTSRKALTILLPGAMLLIFVASIALVQFSTRPTSNGQKTQSAADYQKSLKAQVDNDDGSPVSGRDPSSQSQTSLASAAATPSGTGTRTNTPASGVSGSTTSNKTTPSQVYTAEQQKTGINDAGCFYDYGIPGQQCLSAAMANSDGTIGCNMVTMDFPDGIKVSGTDRFHLDTNHDGTACGKGD